jgi:hypothetical protein
MNGQPLFDSDYPTPLRSLHSLSDVSLQCFPKKATSQNTEEEKNGLVGLILPGEAAP